MDVMVHGETHIPPSITVRIGKKGERTKDEKDLFRAHNGRISPVESMRTMGKAAGKKKASEDVDNIRKKKQKKETSAPATPKVPLKATGKKRASEDVDLDVDNIRKNKKQRKETSAPATPKAPLKAANKYQRKLGEKKYNSLKDDPEWSKKYEGKLIGVGENGVVLEGDPAERKMFFDNYMKLGLHLYIVTHGRPLRKFQTVVANCTFRDPEKLRKHVKVEVSTSSAGPRKNVILQCDEGSDVTWLSKSTIKVKESVPSDEVNMRGISGEWTPFPTYIQYITLDGLTTRVEACRGHALLGENVMRRYRRELDRSIKPSATFNRLRGEQNDY